MGNAQMVDAEIGATAHDGTAANGRASPEPSFIGGLSNFRRPSWIRTSWSMTFRRSRSSTSMSPTSPTSPTPDINHRNEVTATDPSLSPTTDTAVQTPVSVPPDFGERINSVLAERYAQMTSAGPLAATALSQNGHSADDLIRYSTTDAPTSGYIPGVNFRPTISTSSDASSPVSTSAFTGASSPPAPPTSTLPTLARSTLTNPDILRLTHIVPDDEEDNQEESNSNEVITTTYAQDSPLIDSGEGSSSSSLESLRLEDILEDCTGGSLSSSLSSLLRSALRTLRKEGDCLEEKLATLEQVKEQFVEREDQREKAAERMVSLGFPEVYSQLVSRYLEREGSDAGTDSSVESPLKARWKLLEVAYATCVKISDKSVAFGKALTQAGMLRTTTDTLSKEDHRNKCTGEYYCDATSWMLEFIGNCYDDVSREDDLRTECKKAVEWYLECGNESLRLKAGQTMLMMLLKDRVEDRLQAMASAAADGTTTEASSIPPDLLEPTFSPYNPLTSDDTLTGLATAATAPEGSEDVAEALAQELIRRMLGNGPGGAGGSTADEVLDDFMEAMSPEKRRVREAEHMAEIGMHTVYIQNICRWLKDPSRWLAFNEDGKMWGCVHEWFSRLSTLSRASDKFCTAACEGGVGPVLAKLLSTDQIHEAHARNNKVKEVIASALTILLSVTKLRTACKWLHSLRIKDSLKRYGLSKDINIKGLAVLVLANLEIVTTPTLTFCEEESNVRLDFTTEDIDLLLATYLAYKTEGEALGTYLARTNFPEVCVQELRHHISTNEVFQDETWERVHRLLAAMHLFSNRSAEFATALCREDIVTPLRTAIGSPRLRAGIEDENSRRMLHVCLSLVHHCVRLDLKERFLVPSLWNHIHYYATLPDPENPLRWAAFLAFCHIYTHLSRETNQQPELGSRVTTSAATTMTAPVTSSMTSSQTCTLIGPSTSGGSSGLSRSVSLNETGSTGAAASRFSATASNIQGNNSNHISNCSSPARLKNKRLIMNKFPSLKETHDDVRFLNKLWHTTNEQEEPVLGDFIAATGGAEIHARLMEQMVTHLPVITSACNLDKVKMLLANMNNLAIESESFSTKLCSSDRSVLKSLVAIVLSPYIDLAALNSQEEMVLDHTLSAISACSKYRANVESFREARATEAICRFLSTSTVDDSLRRRAWSTLIHLHHHDRSVLEPHLSNLMKTSTNAQEQKFYHKLYHTGRADQVQNMIADFLIEIKVPEIMASSLKDLMMSQTLLSEWELSKHLLHNMWNYSDISEPFTNHFRDAGLFETLREILCDPSIRGSVEQDEKCQDALRATINILFNCSQYDSNRHSLNSLRLVNDLLQFSKQDAAASTHIKTSALLTTAFLVGEDNAHLLRADAKSGVIRFLLERLEDTLFSKTHRSGGFSTVELLKSICQVAMNDANKVVLVYDGLLPILSPFLELSSSPEECQWCCRVLWRLSFVDDNRRAIRDDARLLKALQRASCSDNVQVRTNAQGALFELEKTPDRVGRALERQVRSPAVRCARERPLGKLDVYLSHHVTHKGFFEPLEAALQQDGLRVAASGGNDVNHPFAKMAEVMERSRIFVVELSYAYQHCELCRSEVEYARDLLKPVVPVRLERSFQPSSWLARLVAGRVYVDFSRSPPGSNDFDDRLDELGREVRLVLNSLHRKEYVE